MSKQLPIVNTKVDNINVRFTLKHKPKIITRSKYHKVLEKTSNPKKYRILVSKEKTQHFYHKFRTIYFDISNFDILISFDIKSRSIDSRIFIKDGDFFYDSEIVLNNTFLNIVSNELLKKGHKIKPL